MMGLDYTKRRVMQKRAIRLPLLVASLLAAPASTLAQSTTELDLDTATPNRAGAPSALSASGPAHAAVLVTAPQLTPAPPEHALGANPLWAIPLATLSNTRERPIFSSSRRPPPPAVAPVVVAKAPPPVPKLPVERPQLSLVGTIAGGDDSFGIFVDQTTKAALGLKIGQDYRGWKLRAVQGREVTLEYNQQTSVLSLPQPDTRGGGEVHTQAENTVAQAAANERQDRHGRR